MHRCFLSLSISLSLHLHSRFRMLKPKPSARAVRWLLWFLGAAQNHSAVSWRQTMCRTGVQSRFEAPHMPAANTRDSTRTEKARPPRCFLLLYKCINAYKNERDSTERGVKNRRNSSRSLLLWIFTCMLSAVIPYVFSVGVKDLRRQWRLSFKFLQLFQCCRDISIKRFYVLYLECLPHDFRNMAAPDLAKKRPLCVLLSRTEIIEQACIYWSKNINFNVVSNYDWRQLIKEKTKTSWQSVYI